MNAQINTSNTTHEINTSNTTHEINTSNTTHEIKPTLRMSDCMQLVSLSVGIPSLEKNDKKLATELAVVKHAKEGRLRVPKKLVDSAHLQECKRIEGEMRAYLRSKTADYDRGRDLLPNEYIIDVMNTMRSYFTQLEHHRDMFLQDYPAQVARAQLELGDAFDETDYPSLSTLRSKFRWSFFMEPMPEPTDFRGNIEADIRKELAEMYEASVNSRMQEAMKNIWDRLLVPLKNMSSRLTDKENGKPTGFQGTLVQNVLDIVEIMRTCNFMQDPEMERVRTQLRDALTGVTYDGLKSSASLRADTKAKIDNIINNIPSLGW
jgi:hypothetical protein